MEVCQRNAPRRVLVEVNQDVPQTRALQILPTTELLSNFLDHLSSVSEVHPRVGERISAILCRVGDTPTDVSHPHPRLSQTGILLCESSSCQVASLDVPLVDAASQGQVMRLEHRLQTSSGVIIDEVLKRSGQKKSDANRSLDPPVPSRSCLPTNSASNSND